MTNSIQPDFEGITLNLSAYNDLGFYVVRNAIDQATLSRWRETFEAFYNDTLAGGRLLTGNGVDVYEDQPAEITNIHTHPALIALGQRLFGEDLALYYQRTVIKDRHFRGAIDCHQDFPYYAGHDRKASLFVCLTEANEANGSMWFVPGTHKFGYIGQRGTILYEKYPELQPVCPSLQPGDVVVMDFYTWHFSRPSQNEDLRAFVQCMYQPADDRTSTKLLAGQWRTTFDLPMRPNLVNSMEDYYARLLVELADEVERLNSRSGLINRFRKTSAAPGVKEALHTAGLVKNRMKLG